MTRTRLGTLLAAIALVACNNGEFADPPLANDATLERFSSCGALEIGFVDAYTEQLVNGFYGYRNVYAEEDMGGDDSSGGDAPSDYSSTNVQEAGVDEPDLVKTNGTHVFVVDPSWYGTNSLHIVKSWPVEDSAVIATVELDGAPYSMFLEGDRLVVYQYIYDLPVSEGRGYGGGTRISIIDVSDPANPVEMRQIDVEGYMNTARRIDQDVYTVINSYAYMPEAIWALYEDLPDATDYWDMSEAEQQAWREEARAIIRPKVAQIVGDIGVENLIPRKWDHLPGEEVDAEPLTDCGDIYHPQGTSAPAMLTVAHFGLDDADGTDLSATTLMSDGWQVYASPEALYVAQSSWWWWWGYGDLDMSTHIHKFELTGADTAYVASGKVDGWISNQFSFGEYNGDLRVATGDFWFWGCGSGDCTQDPAEPANNVFVLRQNGDSLDNIGEIRGIAPGETIQSTRFLGPIGFMVTFEQTDPLFSLDLSDPTAPRVAGELQMPGFSSYLHPIEGDKLLAVGMAGDADGNIRGMKLNIFDVSDLANPTIADELEITTGDYSYSEALWDHHAFTYHRDNLSLPLYAYDWDDANGDYDMFSGILSIDVDPDNGTLTEVGRVSHQDLVDDSICLWDEYWGRGYGYEDDGMPNDGSWSYCDENDYGYWYWYASVRRSVVIEDHLLSISDYGIKVTALDDPSVVEARVLFYPAE